MNRAEFLARSAGWTCGSCLAAAATLVESVRRGGATCHLVAHLS